MGDKEQYNIKTEEDFNRVLEVIDKEMRDENIPIVARQFQGWFRFSSKFGLNLRSDDPLSRKVTDWFGKRYGDKLKIDFAANKIAVSIRGDLYKMKFPTVFGSVNIICDVNWMDKKSPQITTGVARPHVNVLN